MLLKAREWQKKGRKYLLGAVLAASLLCRVKGEEPASDIPLISPLTVRTVEYFFPPEKTKLQIIAENRLNKNFNNILVSPYLRYLTSKDYEDEDYSESFQRYAQRATKRSLTQIGREVAFGDITRYVKEIPFAEIIGDALSGYEERNTIGTPFTPREYEDILLRKPSFRDSLKFSIRPFRLNPRAYATFSRGNYSAQLSLDSDQDLQISMLMPLTSSTLLSLGAEISEFDSERISYGIALQKRLGKYSVFRMGASFSTPHVYTALTVRF